MAKIRKTKRSKKAWICPTCKLAVRKRQVCVACTGCRLWVHSTCSGYSACALKQWTSVEKESFTCTDCSKVSKTVSQIY